MLANDVVAAGSDLAAFGAAVYRDGAAVAYGVFVPDGIGGAERLLTTDAPVAALEETTLVTFLYPLREAIHVAADGRTLVHAGLRLKRLPGATLGALLLFD